MVHPRLPVILLGYLLLLAAPGVLWAQSSLAGDDYLSPEQAFDYQLSTNADGSVTLSWNIAPDYYLYRKRMNVEGVDSPIRSVDYPDGEIITDEFFGDSEVYFNSAQILIQPQDARKLKLTWQGCAEAGLCYPPQHTTVTLDRAGAATGKAQATAADGPGSPAAQNQATDQSLARQLADSGLLLNLAIFFGLGLLLVFTPCVLPMIPILSAVIVGSQARRARALWLSSVFVVSMAFTYALLGVAAALAGANLQAALQAPVFIVPLAVIFVLLALAMFGIYELRIPAVLRQRLDRVNQRQKGGSLTGAAVMGFLSALLASPCMTAPLAGALIYIVDTGDATLGGLALLALGLGMGAPLILLATVGSGLLPKPGRWMVAVKAAFGFILLGTAVWFLERIIPGPAELLLWGALALGLGLTLWRLRKPLASAEAVQQLVGSVGLLICLWGGLMVIGGAAGGDQWLRPLQPFVRLPPQAAETVQPASETEFTVFKSKADLDEALDKAGSRGQWTLVEFYADWCVSCKVIEEEVFGDPAVQKAMADMQLLQADVTRNDAIDQALMRQLQVVGPPTILLFGPDGKEYRAQRTVGEISAEAFLDRLESAHSS